MDIKLDRLHINTAVDNKQQIIYEDEWEYVRKILKK